MPANVLPVFSKGPWSSGVGGVWTNSSTANVKSDGAGTIGTDILKIATAGANGAFLQKIVASLGESTISTASTATVLRVWVSSQTSGATTNANTWLLREIALATQTPSSTVAGVPVEIPLGLPIPANYTILVSMHHVAAASTQWQFWPVGGDY